MCFESATEPCSVLTVWCESFWTLTLSNTQTIRQDFRYVIGRHITLISTFHAQEYNH